MIAELNIRPFQAVLSDKAFAYHESNTLLIYDLQRAHLIHAFLFLTKINYWLIVLTVLNEYYYYY